MYVRERAHVCVCIIFKSIRYCQIALQSSITNTATIRTENSYFTTGIMQYIALNNAQY